MKRLFILLLFTIGCLGNDNVKEKSDIPIVPYTINEVYEIIEGEWVGWGGQVFFNFKENKTLYILNNVDNVEGTYPYYITGSYDEGYKLHTFAEWHFEYFIITLTKETLILNVYGIDQIYERYQ